jgi:hypothetical protein
LFIFFSLFLSFTHFTMNHKKHTCLLSAKIDADSSTMVRRIPLEVYTDAYTYSYYYYYNSKPPHFMVLCFYVWQQWKWKSTGTLSFLQKKAKEHWALDYRYGLEQVNFF